MAKLANCAPLLTQPADRPTIICSISRKTAALMPTRYDLFRVLTIFLAILIIYLWIFFFLSLSFSQQCSSKQNFSNQNPNEVLTRSTGINNSAW